MLNRLTHLSIKSELLHRIFAVWFILQFSSESKDTFLRHHVASMLCNVNGG